MGFMDNLRKLTQPYGDEDDFYDGADSAFLPQQQPQEVSNEQLQFESSFAQESAPAPEQPAVKKAPKLTGGAGGLFGGLGEGRQEKAAKPSRRNRNASFAVDQSVIRFNPKDFDEAGELVGYLEQGRSLIMSLEDLPAETARRLLDFMSGIAFALNGKINPVSAKTYFVTPENVDLLDAQRPSGDAEQ